MSTATAAAASSCHIWDLGCNAAGISDAVSGGAGAALAALAQSVDDAVAKALTSLGSAWVDVRTPDLTTGGAAGFLQDSLSWYAGALAVLAVIVGGARMAWEQRAQPGRDLLRGLLTLVLVAAGGLTAISLAAQAADAFASWLLDRSTAGTDLGRNLVALVNFNGANGGTNYVLAIVLGLVALLATFVQIMLMVARSGLLVIMAGVLPLTASFTSTETGRAWLRRSLSWSLAFVLYKPAAAVVYATAFRLVGANIFGTDGLTNVLVGLVLMVLALFALPALLRFVTPLVAATAAGGGGAGALAAAGLAAAPSGAMALGGRSRSAGGPGGAGSGGSSAPGGAGPTPGGSTPTPPAAPAAGAGRGATVGASGAGAGGAGASGAAGTAGPAGAATSAALQAGSAAARAAKDTGAAATGDGAEGATSSA